MFIVIIKFYAIIANHITFLNNTMWLTDWLTSWRRIKEEKGCLFLLKNVATFFSVQKKDIVKFYNILLTVIINRNARQKESWWKGKNVEDKENERKRSNWFYIKRTAFEQSMSGIFQDMKEIFEKILWSVFLVYFKKSRSRYQY